MMLMLRLVSLRNFLLETMRNTILIIEPSGNSCLPEGKHMRKYRKADWTSFRGLNFKWLAFQCHLTVSRNMPSGWGSFLKGITEFDNVEFGISSKDAMSMTASTRRAIELSFLALLDSGIDSREKRIGTFMVGTNAEAFEGVGFVMRLNAYCNS
jgi:hypothetical protein